MLKTFTCLNKGYFLAGGAIAAVLIGVLTGLYPIIAGLAFLGLLMTILSFSFPHQTGLVLIFSLPFLPALNLSSSIDLASSRVLVILVFLVWLVNALLKKNLKIPFGKISFFLVLFCGWMLLSFFYTPIFERTFRKTLVILNFCLLYFAFFGFIKEQKEAYLYKIFKTIAYSTFIVSLMAFVQFWLQFLIGKEKIINVYSKILAPFLWGENTAQSVSQNPSWLFDAGFADVLRAFATLPDPHILSYFFAFGLPVQVALLIIERRKPLKVLYLFFAIFSLAVEFLTFSRGGYLGFVVAAIFALICIFYRKISLKMILGGIIAAVVLLIALAVFPENAVTKRFVSSFDVYEGSNQGRLEVWLEALTVFKEHPLLGVGMGAYSYEIKPSANYREPIYAHNLYLELLAETGIIGLSLWLGLISSAIIISTRFFLINLNDSANEEKIKKLKILSLALVTSLVWFSVHSFFEVPIYSSVILPLLIVTLAQISYIESSFISPK